MKNIILASNSPRRKELLERNGIKFKVITSDCKENNSKQYDENNIINNSKIKASAVIREGMAEAVVIAADTMVILDSVCLVKPQNILEAIFMLKKLSNKTHMVVTSHTIINSKTGQEDTRLSKSYVTFRKLTLPEIIKYVLTKKPLDKAGSYGIQDFVDIDNINNPPASSFISKLDGSFYNVVGFDIDLVKEMLSNF